MEDIPQITVEVKIGEEEFTRNINEDLLVDPNNLDECLEKQAALYAYYSVRLQQATALRDQLEFEMEKTTNIAIQTARAEFIGSSTRITDKQIMAIVDTEASVLAARQEYLDAGKQRDQLYSLVRALEHKKDAILAVAYKRRSEIDALMHSSVKKSVPKSGIEDDI